MTGQHARESAMDQTASRESAEPAAASNIVGLSRNLLAALQYARIGWHVFPIDQTTKRPLIAKWEQDASTDPSTIRAWWKKRPNAGIGGHTGKSGLVVVDVDPRNGGDETLKAIEKQAGPLWGHQPLIARTGGGGSHFVFRSPSDAARLPGKLGPGIDLLRNHRYFIVAPSLHPSGNVYAWEPSCGPFDTGALEAMPELPEEVLGITPADVVQGASAEPAATVRDVDGEALTWLNPTEPAHPEKVRLVRDALAKISPDCDRADYLAVLAGLHSTGWADAGDIAEGWAAGSLEDKYKERDFRRDWASLKIDRRGALVTLGTVFELATRGGWVDPRSKPGTAQIDTFGDLSNGLRLARKYRGQFLHVRASEQWMRWTGSRWQACSGDEIKAARFIVEQALDEAFAALRKDPTERNRSNHSHALAVHRNARRLDALLTVAATEDGMGVPSVAMFDCDPWRLGVRNGVVNLKTGTLLQPDPALMICRQAGASFDREAKCLKWHAFLDSIFDGDSEMTAFIQRAVGYSLTGLVDEEVLFLMYGRGANGKSVFANVLQAVFGEYAVTVRAAMLARDAKGNGSDAEREKARLPGARLVLINEVGTADVFDDQRVKELVSRERISARQLYAESFDFMPSHTIWVRGNHQPGAIDTTDGFWRRIVLIGFLRQFAERERIADLDRQIISDECDGVLAWAVEGCLAWQRVGLQVPASIRAASAQYRASTDLMAEWIESCCRLDPSVETTSRDLFHSYCAFLQDANVRQPGAPAFGRQIADRGFKSRKSNGRALIKGLALVDPFDSSDEEEL